MADIRPNMPFGLLSKGKGASRVRNLNSLSVFLTSNSFETFMSETAESRRLKNMSRLRTFLRDRVLPSRYQLNIKESRTKRPGRELSRPQTAQLQGRSVAFVPGPDSSTLVSGKIVMMRRRWERDLDFLRVVLSPSLTSSCIKGNIPAPQRTA